MPLAGRRAAARRGRAGGRGGEKSRAERGSAALLLPPLPPPPPRGRAEPSARRTQSGARTSGGATASPQPGLRAAPHRSALPCRPPPAACCCWPRCSAEEPGPLEVNRAAGGRGRLQGTAGIGRAKGACPPPASAGCGAEGGEGSAVSSVSFAWGEPWGGLHLRRRAVREGRRRRSPARPRPGGRSVRAGRALM